jgi:hypothetical protein
MASDLIQAVWQPLIVLVKVCLSILHLLAEKAVKLMKQNAGLQDGGSAKRAEARQNTESFFYGINAISTSGKNSLVTYSTGSEKKQNEISGPDAAITAAPLGAKKLTSWSELFSGSHFALQRRIASPILSSHFHKTFNAQSVKTTSKLVKSPKNTDEESRDKKKFMSFLSRNERQLAPNLEDSSLAPFQEPYEENESDNVEFAAFTPHHVNLTAQQDYQATAAEPERFQSVAELDNHWRDSYFRVGAFASQQAEFDRLAASQTREGQNFHASPAIALPEQGSWQKEFDSIHEANPIHGFSLGHANRGSFSTGKTTISSRRPSKSTRFSGGSRDSMDTGVTQLSSVARSSSLHQPSEYQARKELKQFADSTAPYFLRSVASFPPTNLRQPVPRSAAAGLPHTMMGALGPMAPLPNPNLPASVTTTSSTSFRRPFRPTNMLLRHIGAIEDKPNKNSNYLGDIDHQLRLPQHLNCCLWITGIPDGVGYAEFIRTIETGAVAAVNMSAPDTNHSTQGAKVIFKKPAAVEKLFRLAREHPYFRVRGQRLNVWYNHYGREEWLGHQTRYLEIESPDILDSEYWNALFGKWCRHTVRF